MCKNEALYTLSFLQFTSHSLQPAMKKRIDSHDKVVDIYSAKLMDSGIVIKEYYEVNRASSQLWSSFYCPNVQISLCIASQRDRDEYYRMCNDTAQKSKGMATSKHDWLDSPQEGIISIHVLTYSLPSPSDLPSSTGHIPSTGITERNIHHVGVVYCTIPNNIKPHSGRSCDSHSEVRMTMSNVAKSLVILLMHKAQCKAEPHTATLHYSSEIVHIFL